MALHLLFTLPFRKLYQAAAKRKPLREHPEAEQYDAALCANKRRILTSFRMTLKSRRIAHHQGRDPALVCTTDNGRTQATSRQIFLACTNEWRPRRDSKPNPQIRSLMLYPVELRGLCSVLSLLGCLPSCRPAPWTWPRWLGQSRLCRTHLTRAAPAAGRSADSLISRSGTDPVPRKHSGKRRNRRCPDYIVKELQAHAPGVRGQDPFNLSGWLLGNRPSGPEAVVCTPLPAESRTPGHGDGFRD